MKTSIIYILIAVILAISGYFKDITYYYGAVVIAILSLYWIWKERKQLDKQPKIIDSEGLHNKKDDAKCKGYFKLKKTYHRLQLKNKIKGKRVKYWKLVYSADDEDGDEYIPIYYKSKRKKR